MAFRVGALIFDSGLPSHILPKEDHALKGMVERVDGGKVNSIKHV
jgi:hypothetical protein